MEWTEQLLIDGKLKVRYLDSNQKGTEHIVVGTNGFIENQR